MVDDTQRPEGARRLPGDEYALLRGAVGTDRRVCVGAVQAHVKRSDAFLRGDGAIVELGRRPAGPGHYVGCVDSLQSHAGAEWLVLVGFSFSTSIRVDDLRWACWREDADRLHPAGEPVHA